MLQRYAEEYFVVISITYNNLHSLTHYVDWFIIVVTQNNWMPNTLIEATIETLWLVRNNSAFSSIDSIAIVYNHLDFDTYWTLSSSECRIQFCRCKIIHLIELFNWENKLSLFENLAPGLRGTIILLEPCNIVTATPKFYKSNSLILHHSEDNLIIFTIILYSVQPLQKHWGASASTLRAPESTLFCI